MPTDPEAAIRAVVDAVKKGRLTTKRSDQSVARVLASKQSVGLDRARLVNLEAIADAINSPEAAARAQEITDRAVTLVKNDNATAPLHNPKEAAYVILTEGRYSTEGQALAQELTRRGAATQFALDPTMPDSELDAVGQKAGAAAEIVGLAFASATAYRGSLTLPGPFPQLADSLMP